MTPHDCSTCREREQRIRELEARVAELDHAQRQSDFLRKQAREERDLRPLTGDSPGMKRVRQAIQQVARTDSTVLIQGETGTGKELVARAIHQLSDRREHLLVAVNCAALSPGIIASELFGHEAGAFTGANRRRLGRFELAHQGTIFLDEIGELPAEAQVMLLRVLQERSLERVGGSEPFRLDVRVVAATHRDLAAAVRTGQFRSDLYFRLNVFPINVPPLRERRTDIADLVKYFLQHFSRRANRPAPQLALESLERLKQYTWPGNVRELENLLERALIVSEGSELHIDPMWLQTVTVLEEANGDLRTMEKRTIEQALAKCRGKIYGPDGAAALLGLKPTTLYGKMRKYRIPRREPATT